MEGERGRGGRGKRREVGEIERGWENISPVVEREGGIEREGEYFSSHRGLYGGTRVYVI